MASETEKSKSNKAAGTSEGAVLAADVKATALPGNRGGCPLPGQCCQARPVLPRPGQTPPLVLAVGSHREEFGNQCLDPRPSPTLSQARLLKPLLASRCTPASYFPFVISSSGP